MKAATPTKPPAGHRRRTAGGGDGPRWHMHPLDAAGRRAGPGMCVPGRGDLAAARAEVERQWNLMGIAILATTTRAVAVTDGPGGPEVARIPVEVPTLADLAALWEASAP